MSLKGRPTQKPWPDVVWRDDSRGTLKSFVYGAMISFSCLVSGISASAQSLPMTQSPTVATQGSTLETPGVNGSFDKLADEALLSMRATAAERKVGGVAIVAYFEGATVQGWTSKMVVVGRMKDEPSASAEKGNNLLAIVYAKAAEMADTLKNSGSKARPPMVGEFGWEGGVIAPVKGGYLIAAFSGGPSSDDVAISHAGLDRMIASLKVAQIRR